MKISVCTNSFDASTTRTCPLRAPKLNDFPLSESRRRLALAVPAILVARWSDRRAFAETKKPSPRLVSAFNKALEVSGDPEKADKAWTDVIDLDPTNSYSWSNRGTIRLQQGNWAGAKSDLEKAYQIESADGGQATGIVLNNLGNACGALGDWDEAMEKFKMASLDEEITPIALANLALALFQVEKTEDAISQARALVRKDPNFIDMRAALTGFLWSKGDEVGAEEQWSQLQSANDGLGGMVYTKQVAIKRVQGRWPPRAVAALDAFLKVSREGQSLDYDKQLKKFSF